MANPSIRGHQGQFKIFENGSLANIVDLTTVEVNQDSTFMRTMYVGRSIPEGDQAIEGWSGSSELEVRDAAVGEGIDAVVANDLNGSGVGG